MWKSAHPITRGGIAVESIRALLSAIAQPVFVFRDGSLTDCNPAAAALGELSEASVQALTRALSEPGQLRLADRCWDTQVQPLEGLELLFLTASPLPTQLLDVVSQSLRSPLTTAILVSQTLLPKLTEPQQPQAAMLTRSLYRMLRMTDNLSVLSQLAQNQLSLRREPMDAAAWLTELGEPLAAHCRACSVTVRIEAPESPCSVWMDAELAERALLNLVSNALKYSHDGGCIRIRMELSRTLLRIRVFDDGEGIDAALLGTLFRQWEHRSPMDDPRSGVGLGLSLASQIAQLHGGTLLYEPQSRGGACMTLSLDISEPAGPSAGFRSPAPQTVYRSGFDAILLELSDALPAEAYLPKRVNE